MAEIIQPCSIEREKSAESVVLEPRLVIITGFSATGKTTTTKELSSLIANSFVLDKDLLNQAISIVPNDDSSKLPPVTEYVKLDNVDFDDAHKISTPFGEMFSIDPVTTDFYRRHARDQSYMAMMYLAAYNLGFGKVPILDCFSINVLRYGALKRLIEQPMFDKYPICVIHFVAEEDDCYKRTVERAEIDPAARTRDESKITSRERFHQFVTEEQPMLPDELAQYEHIVINTSEGTPLECAIRCLEYIKSATLDIS